MNSPFGPGREKAEYYPEHSPLALIAGLPATTGVANRPELECGFRKIYTTEFPVAAMARQKRTGVRSKVDVIIWDLTEYFGRDARGDGGLAILKNGKFENRTTKDGKRTNLRTINLYRPRGMNPRGRPMEIQIACLESWAEMPAFASVIDLVLEEGGVLQPSWGPKQILGNGKLQGIELVRCTRVFDDAGRFNPSCDLSVATVIEADTVILAIGQSTDFSFLGDAARSLLTERGPLRIDEANLATPVAGVYAGGEAVTGPPSMIQAIATGRKAAMAIDRQLGGDGVIDDTFATALELDPRIGGEGNFASLRRESMPYLSLAERQKSFGTIERGYDESIALREARRCLRCDSRLQIGVPVLSPEQWLEFDQEHVATVSATEGVYQLLDTDKKVLRIAGAADLRQALQEQLNSTSRRATLFMKKRLCTHSARANSWSPSIRSTGAYPRAISLATIFSESP